MSSKRRIPQSQICCCDSHETLAHSNTPSCSGIKNTPPFKNSKSDLRSAWELRCLLAGVWWAGLLTSCPGLFSPSWIFFFTVQPDPAMDRGEAGAQESVWHNCNNWGSVCEASRREKEKTGLLLGCALLEETTTRLWLTVIILCGLHYWMGIWSGHAFNIRLSLSGMEEEEFELWPQCGRIEDLRTLCNNETLLFTVMAVKVHSLWQPLNRWRSESRCVVGL